MRWDNLLFYPRASNIWHNKQNPEDIFLYNLILQQCPWWWKRCDPCTEKLRKEKKRRRRRRKKKKDLSICYYCMSASPTHTSGRNSENTIIAKTFLHRHINNHCYLSELDNCFLVEWFLMFLGLWVFQNEATRIYLIRVCHCQNSLLRLPFCCV